MSRTHRHRPLALTAMLVTLVIAGGVLPVINGSSASAAQRHAARFASFRVLSDGSINARTHERVRAKVRVVDRANGRPARGRVWFIDARGLKVSPAVRLGARGWATVSKNPLASTHTGTRTWRVRYGGSTSVRPQNSRSFSFRITKPSGPDRTVDHRFAAIPDYLNLDLGDVSGQRNWTPAVGNSSNPHMAANAIAILERIAAFRPGAVLLPGDLVEGRWGHPNNRTGVFGTPARPRAMASAQARFYHGRMVARFKKVGLFGKTYVGIGDHDIGDNPWGDNAGRYPRWKRTNLGLWRNAFADHYTRTSTGRPRYGSRPVGTEWEHTAYAAKINRDTLLVSVDVFDRTHNRVKIQVVDGQLRWLDRVLRRARAAGTKWIIVQGHVPVLRPVRERYTSGLKTINAASSRFWQTMKRHRVNLYLTGEAHDTSRKTRDRITQINTGGLMHIGQSAYLTAKMFRGRIELAVHEWNVPPKTRSPQWLWQGGCTVRWELTRDCPGTRNARGNRDYAGYAPRVRGRLTIYANGATTTGQDKLRRY